MFRKDLIELNHSNYKNYIPINMIAFYYAYGGAQGEPNEVIIMDKDGKLFRFNYMENDFIENEKDEICPMIKDLESRKSLKEYSEKYMGAGNFLYYNNSISEEVEEKTKDIKGPGALYNRWPQVILEIIKK